MPLIALILAQMSAAAPPKVAASVARIFGRPATTTPLVVNADTVFRVTRGDTLLGFAVVRAVKGKDQPITFLREPYGGEVAYESWRRQFRGKSAADTLEVGRQIRSISGATISVNAVTAGVRRALADLTTWHQSGAIK
jgi:hypothetical protein